MSLFLEAEVVAFEALARNNFLLTIRAPELAQASRPGQFVMVSEKTGLSLPAPLLKRAVAVYDTGVEAGQLSLVRFLVKVVGDGTSCLSRLRPGNQVSLVGPLGNGFEIPLGNGLSHLMVVGGIGIASVLLAARRIVEAGEPLDLVYGGRSAEDLVCRGDFESLGIAVHLATEDGSLGLRGLVTDKLLSLLSERGRRSQILYTCGPNPMMRAVSRIAAAARVPCQISVETKMACGFGVCLGCSVKTITGYRLACTIGPVFPADQFVWEPPEGALP